MGGMLMVRDVEEDIVGEEVVGGIRLGIRKRLVWLEFRLFIEGNSGR